MTESQRRLSQKYLAYRTLTSMWVVVAVWLYFYRIFINDQQIGVLDGMAFAVGLLAEVPSGALADKFGRDKVLKAGQILIAVGLFIQAVGGGFMPLFVGQAIMMIGLAFASGADDALFFRQLNFKKGSTQWRRLVTRGAQMGLAGAFVATIIGGWLHTVNPHVPWVVNGLLFLAAAAVIWNVTDTRPRQARQTFLPEIKSYLSEIKTGFTQFRLPKLWFYVPFMIAVQGLFYTTGYGLLRLVLLDRFEFDPFWGSVAVASSSLITVGLLGYMYRHADKLSEKRMLTIIGLGAAAALLLSLGNLGVWGYVVILALYAGEHVLQPFISEVLNNRAPEAQRATVLSVASFFKTLPYLFLAPIIGFLNSHDQLEYFLIGWAVVIVVAVVVYLSAKQRDTQVGFKQDDLSTASVELHK